MKRLILLFVLVVSLAARADLAGDVQAILADKLLRKAEVGVQIVRLGGPQPAVLYRLNSDLPLVPASNLKVVTTAAALDKLGGDFRFRTQLALHGRQLVLIGDGDPTFGDAELLRKSPGWGVRTVFEKWAELLKNRGITRIEAVAVDDSIFDEQFKHPHWPADQEHRHYVAQVGGVSLNINCVNVFVRPAGRGRPVDYVLDPPTRYITMRNTCIGGDQHLVGLARRLGTNDVILSGEARVSSDVPFQVTVHDPPLYAGTVLAETLAAAGITVEGGVSRQRSVRTGEGLITLATHETELGVVLARANKDSVNLYAESLCKRLGAAVSGQSGSWTNGTAAIGAFLHRLGVPEDQYQLDDGSGLSKENAISARAIVAVLAHEYTGNDRAAYLASLSAAGSDGTLSDRFRNSDLQGRVFGKSGFVSGVSALSGYLKGRDGQWYAFSILMNDIPPGSNSGIKPLQERIVRAVDNSLR